MNLAETVGEIKTSSGRQSKDAAPEVLYQLRQVHKTCKNIRMNL